MRETRLLKIGIPLAIRYDTTVAFDVQPSQVAQCIRELSVRCLVPRRMQKKMYLLGTKDQSAYRLCYQLSFTYMKDDDGAHRKAWQ